MKYNIKGKLDKRRTGGGGATTVESVPSWAAPYVQNAMAKTEEQYNAGNLDNVAGTSDLQTQAFTTGAQGINQATTGGLTALQQQQQRLTSLADTPNAAQLDAQKNAVVLDAQKKVAGMDTQFGQAGTLGSARQAVMQGAQNADTTAKLAQVDADYSNKMFQNRLAAEQQLGSSVAAGSQVASTGASSLANLGNQQRGIDQQQLDADWQGLQRYASTIYGTPAKQSAVTNGKGL
jgi:hypothetical protein